MRRTALLGTLLLCVTALPCGAAQAGSARHWRTITIHQAWLVTVKGAHGVARQAESAPHTYGPSRPSSVEVQPQGACRRRSAYQVDCPFTYFLGDTSLEVFTECRDTGRVTEIAEQRFRFTSLAPRCRLIDNKTP